MKLLAVKFANRDQGEWGIAALHDSAESRRFPLDDVVLVCRDASGEPELHRTKSRFHRHGLPGPLLEGIARQLEPGGAAVVARGEEAVIDSLGATVRSVSKGDFKTFDVVDGKLQEVTGGETAVIQRDDDESFLREASDAIPLQTGLLVKAPFS